MPSRFALILLMLAPVASVASAAPPIQPFEAEFTVYRNGSEVGFAHIRLSQEGENAWHMHATLNASAAAGLLQFSSVEDSRFHWHEGQPRSDRYHARRQQPLRTRERSMDFDWNAGRVVLTDHRGREETHDLREPAIDPQLSLLVAMLATAEGEEEFDYVMVNRGAPQVQKGRRNGSATVETGLGAVECVEVERVRDHRRRETRSCHARSLDWIPVRVVQEEDGELLEMRLKSLKR
ncbi:MAG TPA: DUF3108 domain-containing protein [Xanthomonadaceae bacterium]|nr:DUF3108 domain-containing protein [Xanthomonadaceae bacterium]